MSKHTPGRWLFNSFSRAVNDPKNPCKVERGYFVQKQRGFDICHLPIQSSTEPEETKANARLIAAAPELLEALRMAEATIERLTERHGLFSSTYGTRSVIRAAIAKAEGGAS